MIRPLSEGDNVKCGRHREHAAPTRLRAPADDMIIAGMLPAILFLVQVLTAAAGPVPDLRIAWEDNLLRITAPELPGGVVEVWYLEAFCRSGAHNREWGETVIKHTTELIEADVDGKRIVLRSEVSAGVIVDHVITANGDEVDFQLECRNPTDQHVDVDWAQPCIRVGAFTGLDQDHYFERCFIFVDGKLTMLDRTRRTEEARYRGGQVYVPKGIDHRDVNPRPISVDVPSNGLIGCFSADDRLLLATAWDRTEELFQGVIKCIHSDIRIGGLDAGETKRLRGKIYVMENNTEALLQRYEQDFPVDTQALRR